MALELQSTEKNNIIVIKKIAIVHVKSLRAAISEHIFLQEFSPFHSNCLQYL